jgi:tRNA nucleotidyltransferase (CCA-adding enzyme)
MQTRYWEHFEHQADIGVRGIGATPSEAFEQAALALTAVVLDPGQLTADQVRQVDCEAPDIELLLAEWLNQIIYLMATEHLLFCRYEVQLEDHRLHATLYGEKLDRQRHQPTVEIKGATYTALAVQQTENGGWIAQTVVDV